jgi:hypothetical protein
MTTSLGHGGLSPNSRAESGRAKLLALLGVLIGATGFAASLTCIYRAARDLMINSGGTCASGGAYQIAPGHQCTPGQTSLLIGGIFAILLFGTVLVAASRWYGGSGLSGVGSLTWAALFGSLGINFLQLGLQPPDNIASGTGWIVCGAFFVLMALCGLIPGLIGVSAYFKARGVTESTPVFDPPIVRANVNFARSMPGDPAFGISDSAAARAAGSGESAPAGDSAPFQADLIQPARTEGDFVDPVTGEHVARSEE